MPPDTILYHGRRPDILRETCDAVNDLSNPVLVLAAVLHRDERLTAVLVSDFGTVWIILLPWQMARAGVHAESAPLRVDSSTTPISDGNNSIEFGICLMRSQKHDV